MDSLLGQWVKANCVVRAPDAIVIGPLGDMDCDWPIIGKLDESGDKLLIVQQDDFWGPFGLRISLDDFVQESGLPLRDERITEMAQVTEAELYAAAEDYALATGLGNWKGAVDEILHSVKADACAEMIERERSAAVSLIGNIIKLPLLICGYCVMWTMQRIFGDHRLDRWTGYEASRKDH